MLSVIVCTVLGMVIERVAYKPLRHASKLAVLITAIGASYFLQNVALLLFGANTKSFTSVVGNASVQLAEGLSVTVVTIVTVIACVIIMIGLMAFMKYSKAGHAMLAVSEDDGAAQLMGINVNATIALTFAIGSGLAAIAGVLLCSAYPSLTPYTGSMPGIKAFVAQSSVVSDPFQELLSEVFCLELLRFWVRHIFPPSWQMPSYSQC